MVARLLFFYILREFCFNKQVSKMAKKQIKQAVKNTVKQAAKKAVKGAAGKASALASKKSAPGKSSKKPAAKSSAKKVVKKNVVRTTSKTLKKSAATAKSAKNTKSFKTSKALTKGAKSAGSKTVAKPVKNSAAKAPAKKAVAKKTTKVVKPAKPVKTVKKVVAPSKSAAKSDSKDRDKKLKKALPKEVIPAVKTAKGPAGVNKEKEKAKKESKDTSSVPDKVAAIKQKPAKRGKGGRKPKNKNDDDEPEIVHDELIEQIIQTTRRQTKQPKGPKIIKTFVNPHESLAAALPEPPKKGAIPKKEPKGKFELEYVVRTSPGILFEFLTTPSGLSEWFADDVNIRDGIFTFFWDGSEQKARLLGYKEEKFLRLRWLDKPEGYYFEFRIERDELTGDISLMIVDFADEASDMQTSKLLWDSQVNKLLHVLGSN
jgi:uncharacterized protein YndB with AHSA1/START domain